MRRFTIFVFIVILSNMTYSQSVIFLHHSTGGNVYSTGDVPEYISNYNSENETDIQITERAYPNSPYPWNNYPYDFWNLWINEGCDNASANTECLESIASSYDIIIWKHCYPGANISSSDAEGDVTSASKTIPNYKAQYRALRDLMDTYPNNKFIVWTLAPLHRLSTNQETAVRAGEFVSWVLNDWLSEDGNDHPNIYIFDFFGIVAEQDENPENGLQYCLKYDYEKSHDGSDSHPNTLANETAGPLFAQFIIDVATGNTTDRKDLSKMRKLNAYPNPTSGPLHIDNLDFSEEVLLYNLLGKKEMIVTSNDIDISELQKGIYFLKTGKQVLRIVKE